MIIKKTKKHETVYVELAIQPSVIVTDQMIESGYVDRAYQRPNNTWCCENIDMIFTGFQDAESRSDLDITLNGLLVFETKQVSE